MFGPFARNMSALCLVRTTLGHREQAEALAQRLVDERLAACVHVTEVSSVYRWNGQRSQETEFIIEGRTTQHGRGRLVAAMLAGHPYEVPLVESWPVAAVPASYLKWAKGQVSG